MEEEINLRPYIEAVIQKWVWIVVGVFLGGVVALGISFLLPSVYKATALVVVTEPRQIVQFDPRIKSTDDSQPYDAYPELAISDQLLLTLLGEIAPIAPEVTKLSTLNSLLTAKTGSDPSLINLSASFADPQIASEIANKWAELFVTRANEVFGTQGEEQLTFFAEQLTSSSAELQQAEEALIDFQARNRAIVLGNQLLALSQTQADYLAKQREILFVLQDAEALLGQLEGTDDEDTSSIDQLAPILLQLRTLSGVSSSDQTVPWQLQVNVDQLESASREDQIKFLSGLQDSLQTQVAGINMLLVELEPQILAVQQAKQEEDAEESRLTRDVDVAEETYTALARKVQEEQITSKNTESGIRLASRSAVPEFSSGPRRLYVIIVGMAAGAIISIIIIIIAAWWNKQAADAR